MGMRRNTATLHNSPGSKVWRAACTNELQVHLSKGKEKGKTHILWSGRGCFHPSKLGTAAAGAQAQEHRVVSREVQTLIMEWGSFPLSDPTGSCSFPDEHHWSWEGSLWAQQLIHAHQHYAWLQDLNWQPTSSLHLIAIKETLRNPCVNPTASFLFTCAASSITARFISISTVAPGAVPGNGAFVLAIHLLALG